ncbi:MAG: DUF433 domain-containing protein [Verrucomicrobia bacterium]|nr:DUF433 domain-containing protein [Verrucomicrobiota bacterium]
MKAKTYPHISRASKILGGIPIVTGTRTSVRAVAGYYQMGMNPDEILQTLPHLTLGQVHAALAYYFDHQKAIDREIARARDVSHWKQQAGQFAKQLA